VSKASKDDQADQPCNLKLYVPDAPEVRGITWQRTIDMYGTIELDLDATWEEVEQALADGRYYLNGDDGLIYLFDEESSGILAVIYPTEREEGDDKSVGVCNDDGFVLGDQSC